MASAKYIWDPDFKMNDFNSLKANIVQENGQVIYLSPCSANMPAPKGTEVFISQIPPTLTIEELLPVAEQCGSVYALRLMMDFSGGNRGFAFVRYADIDSARKALELLSGYEILPSSRIRVQRSLDNCRLFIGQIRKSLKKDELWALLSSETEGLKEVILYLSSTDKNMNRGFCFAEYVNHRAAAMARRKLINLEKIYTWAPYDATLKVDWAIPEGFVDDDTMSKVKIVYVRNMMLRTSECSLRDVLIKVISPSDIVRICKVKDFAFVHFKERAVAEKAISHLKGFDLDGALLEATWAKPAPSKGEQTQDNQKLIKKLKVSERGKLSPSPHTGKNQLVGSYVQPVVEYTIPHIPKLMPKVENNGILPLALTQAYNGHVDGITISQCCSPLDSGYDYFRQMVNFFLTTYPPYTALTVLFQYFHWGNIDFKVLCDTFSCNKPIYSSYVWNKDLNKALSDLTPPAETPTEAMNNCALLFLKKNYSTLLYNTRIPLN